MADPIITVTDAPSAEARAAVFNGLVGYNDAKVGRREGQPLAVLVSDPATAAVVGGVIGFSWSGVLAIDFVFLPERLRGLGLGALMLQRADAEARRRGCRAAVLFTMTYQAPGFYARLGWQEFGRVPSDPPGTERIYFRKEFAAETGREPGAAEPSAISTPLRPPS